MAPPTAPTPWLPDLLRAMSERFGLATALRFAELFGGRYLHLPKVPEPGHPVARALGEQGVAVLAWLLEHERAKASGGEDRIVVPKGPTSRSAVMRARVADLLSERRTVNEIAVETGLHVRDVHRHKARLRDAEADTRQRRLL